MVVDGGGSVGVTCACVPRRGVTAGWSTTSGTTVVVGATVVEAPDAAAVLAGFDLAVTTMGRGPAEDPVFFAAG